MNTTVSLIVTILEFILAISFLAFIHELGHYVVSRLSKIEVEEFGLGLPLPGVQPLTLFTFQGTKFTLNWLPFGAFVRPKGETDPNIPDGLSSASPWKRIGVALGGPFMNLLVGIFLFTLVFTRVGAPNTKVVQLLDVNGNSPAAIAGLLPGDTIVSADGTSIQSMTDLSTIVQSNLGKEITIIYQRDGQTTTISITPRQNPPEGEGALGIVMTNPVVPISWFQSIPTSFEMAYMQLRQLVLLPGELIKGQINPSQARVVGPVGIFNIYNQARQLDQQAASTPGQTLPVVNTLYLLGTISIALGLTNLLPLPALDGGRIIFALPEIIIRRRIPAQYENMVHAIGFILLIILMVYITLQDVIHPVAIP